MSAPGIKYLVEWVNISWGFSRIRTQQTIEYGKDAGKEFTSQKMGFVMPFAICKSPISNRQYQEFVDAPDGYRNKEWWNFHKAALKDYAELPHPPLLEGDDSPRTNISFWNAVAFTRWMSKKLGYPVTLPNAGQWVRALSFSQQQNAGVYYPEFEPYALNPTSSGALKYKNLWEWCLEKGNFHPGSAISQPLHSPAGHRELIGLAREKYLGFRLIKGKSGL